MSGVDAVSFWLATYSWDFINYLFPMVGIIIMFAAFQVDSLKEDLGVIVLLLVMIATTILVCKIPWDTKQKYLPHAKIPRREKPLFNFCVSTSPKTVFKYCS